ncbi:neutral zinc metallopeptidase [Rhodocytophaga aerolata]|uniref:Neutral zinc metallopeptidase n=1 Tax=Rhodocytophaga aerolata TaxID=455078 RepID=A0ABT8R295_9BACT|nr:neutral zinc metallopeptidase [Rhodocytophaga aerolata]MDO1445418.1 neutral zinc metallopeptidase [Rhodocytophaga aerolata]
MRWQGRQGSGNVEDRRGRGGLAIGGGIGGVVLLILGLLFGGNPSELINVGSQSGGQVNDVESDQKAQFVSVVLQDTEDVWNKLFAEQLNQDYQEPTLVLFSGTDQSGCGTATSATGPFYCPLDQKVYIDLSFYDQLQSRFSAPGDFAMAYVVAHEVGHHVQQLLGITDQVRQNQRGMSKAQANELSVRLELQADFLAGVWAHHADAMKNILEGGDIEEALNAANAIGDDRLQMESQGYVVPDAFTHGTSKQRMYWFKKGYQTGDLNQGDTFKNAE